jgi:hypothetical protein
MQVFNISLYDGYSQTLNDKYEENTILHKNK